MNEPAAPTHAAEAADTIPQVLERAYRPRVVAADRAWLAGALWPLTVLVAPGWAGPRLLRCGRIVSVLAPYACLVVSLLAVACGVAILAWGLRPAAPLEFAPWPTLHAERTTDALRWLLATAADALYIASDGRGDIWAVIGVLAGVRLAYAVLGVVAAPLICAGEPLRLALWRAWRLSLQTSVWLAVGALVFLALTLSPAFDGLRNDPPLGLTRTVRLGVFVTTAATAWLSLVWTLRMGDALPAALAGSIRPVRPRCGRCGYVLTGLKPDGVCPECGLRVQASLGQQAALPWAACRRVVRRPAAWLHSVRLVIRDRRHALSAGRDGAPRSARAFAAWNATCAGLLLLPTVGMQAAWSLNFAPWPESWAAGWVALIAGWLTGMQVAWLGAIGLHAGAVGLWQRANVRPVAATACFASAMVLPGVLVIVAGLLVREWLLWALPGTGQVHLLWGRFGLSRATLAALLVVLAGLYLTLHGIGRYHATVRSAARSAKC